ncbi:hypothetical protein IAT40_006831 [Kwoniella sp. CBS 6097]
MASQGQDTDANQTQRPIPSSSNTWVSPTHSTSNAPTSVSTNGVQPIAEGPPTSSDTGEQDELQLIVTLTEISKARQTVYHRAEKYYYADASSLGLCQMNLGEALEIKDGLENQVTPEMAEDVKECASSEGVCEFAKELAEDFIDPIHAEANVEITRLLDRFGVIRDLLKAERVSCFSMPSALYRSRSRG